MVKGGADLSPEEKRICKTLDMFIEHSSKVNKNNKVHLEEILSNCDKITKEDCLVTNYVKKDDWYKFIEQMRGRYHKNEDFIGEMKRTKSILEEQNGNLEQQKEQLENQIIINNHLLKNVFSDKLLVKGNEKEVFENMYTHRTDRLFKTDCEMCDDKNYWQSVLDEMKDLGEEAFDQKLYLTYCDYCKDYDEDPVTSFKYCDRVRDMVKKE